MNTFKIFLLLALVVMVGCTTSPTPDSVKTPFPPVHNLKATSWFGSVVLEWENPGNSELYYVQITTTDSLGVKNQQKVFASSQKDERKGTCMIGGFTDTGTRIFSLRAVSRSGEVSDVRTVQCAPMRIDRLKSFIMESVAFDFDGEWPTLSWKNETNIGVSIQAVYTNALGQKVERNINATQSGRQSLEGIMAPTDVTLTMRDALTPENTLTKTFKVVSGLDPYDVPDSRFEYINFTNEAKSYMPSPTQPNPYNPNQWRFTTSGPDPWCFMSRLKAKRTGTYLVFRYKASADFKFEMYWCTPTQGPHWPALTTFTVKASNTWTTFRQNLATEFQRHGWQGNVGDYFRCDWGEKANVTIEFRNMHFE